MTLALVDQYSNAPNQADLALTKNISRQIMEMQEAIPFPGMSVPVGEEIDHWGWRYASQEDLDSILENIGGQPDGIGLLLQELRVQERIPSELDNLEVRDLALPEPIVCRGFDSDSGSMGHSIADPQPYWPEPANSVDSGVDQRMVNLPIHWNNAESPNSSQLEYSNWIDIYAPGNMVMGPDDAPDSGSDYGPEGHVDWEDWDSSQAYSSPPFPPFPPNRSFEYSNNNSMQLSPVITPILKHLPGCGCNGCNRLSPVQGGTSTNLSFPVDPISVTRRLEAFLELERLQVNVDEVHRAAEIEEREIITEYYYLQRISTPRSQDGWADMLPSPSQRLPPHPSRELDVKCITAEGKKPILNSSIQDRLMVEDLPFPDHESLDIDLVHEMAEKEEEESKKAYFQHNLRKATFEMVSFCTRELEIDKWEALADEIFNSDIPVPGGMTVTKNFSTVKPP